jgi:hypothetical protein
VGFLKDRDYLNRPHAVQELGAEVEVIVGITDEYMFAATVECFSSFGESFRGWSPQIENIFT